MIPWVQLDSTRVPGDGVELQFYQRGDEYSIRIPGQGELMNSRMHGSEDALAEETWARLQAGTSPSLLIGGLGMGFTLAAALKQASKGARIAVAELVPAVIRWNQETLGELSGHPLRDARVKVLEDDVVRVIKSAKQKYDAILLDVDNGPEGVSRKENNWLYGRNGLRAAQAALRPRGVLAVWSANPDPAFVQRLRKARFEVDEVRAYARGKKGARHTLWFARKN